MAAGNICCDKIIIMKKAIGLMFFLQYVLLSCWMQRTDPYPKQDYIYNPGKAGAEIITHINVPKGYYICFTNNHYYLIGHNNIQIFDLSGDEAIILNEIDYDFTPWESEINGSYGDIYRCGGIADTGNKIIFLFFMSMSNKVLFSMDANGTHLGLSDLSSDIVNYDNLSDFYYDNASQILYTSYKVQNDGYFIDKYYYNDSIKHFEYQENLCHINSTVFMYQYLSENYLIMNHFEDLAETDNWNELLIYRYDTTKKQKINLMHLRLYDRPLSAFSDNDGDIWLYGRKYIEDTKQYKYELLKLKLLE